MEQTKIDQSKIRNFCIIAHIDHGKSTLADRFLETTGTVDKRKLQKQTLDSMELEREKGITIKLKAVRMNYTFEGEHYQLNLIDTPGHVDFAYEVSRSLAACEGAILIVDATQGIQAQTVSNVYKALEADLKIIPVLNKIDIASAEVEKVTQDIVSTFGFSEDEILKVSAKTGEGVDELLGAVIGSVPPPTGLVRASPRAMVFDTFYDEFQGVVALVRVFDGGFSPEVVKNRKKILMMATNRTSVCESIGILRPGRVETNELKTGEVGYIVTGVKDIHSVHVGDTITLEESPAEKALLGYRESKPFVFVSIYPIDNDQFPDLREALEKLALSDAALSYEPESNSALGFGFRCGFLGLLHADIIQERLEREYNLELISTTPTVEYEVTTTDGTELSIRSPSELPHVTKIKEIREPWITLNIVSPSEYVGNIITLCEERRGEMKKMDYPTPDRVIFEYEIPLNELIRNFFDDLKTISSGFASLDYQLTGYRTVRAVKVDILVHGQEVPPLSQIVVKDRAEEFGRAFLKKLKDVIPRQQFQVSLQVAINGKIIAREDLSGYRKDVTAKLYGGHRERKDKLLDNQKKNKARMKKLGKVSIPQEAFREVLGV